MGKIKITVITAAMLLFHFMTHAQEQETEGDTWSNDYNYQRGTQQDEQTREEIEGESGETTDNADADRAEAVDTVHEGLQEDMENVTDTVEQREYDNQYERNKAADKLGKKVEKRARKIDEALDEDESSPEK